MTQVSGIGVMPFPSPPCSVLFGLIILATNHSSLYLLGIHPTDAGDQIKGVPWYINSLPRDYLAFKPQQKYAFRYEKCIGEVSI